MMRLQKLKMQPQKSEYRIIKELQHTVGEGKLPVGVFATASGKRVTLIQPV